MPYPYVGEIKMFAGNYAPSGWMFCHGQLLPIAENETLFQLIGTTYGGDGETTYALPDLRGRIPIHMGAGPGLTSRGLAESGGSETVTLSTNQLPAHNHVASASSSLGHISEPEGAAPAAHRDFTVFSQTANTAMASAALQNSGGSQPHENVPPFLCVNYIISLFGVFPSPT